MEGWGGQRSWEEVSSPGSQLLVPNSPAPGLGCGGLSSPASCPGPGSAMGLDPGQTRSFALSDTCSLRCSSCEEPKPDTSLDRRKCQACVRRENPGISLKERAELVRESEALMRTELLKHLMGM